MKKNIYDKRKFFLKLMKTDFDIMKKIGDIMKIYFD